MKIKRYPPNWSGWKIPYTKEELKFVKALESNRDFKARIKEIRLKYQIPLRGFTTYKESEVGGGIPKYLPFERWDEYLEDEDKIMDDFGFSSSWGVSLSLYIKYNYLQKRSDTLEPRAFIFDGNITLRHLLDQIPYERSRTLYIGIRESLNRSELIALLDNQWDQIDEGMKSLPKRYKTKQRYLDVLPEIISLKEDRNLRWSEIAQIMLNKYPELDNLNDEANLKQIYHRNKKKFSNLKRDT